MPDIRIKDLPEASAWNGVFPQDNVASGVTAVSVATVEAKLANDGFLISPGQPQQGQILFFGSGTWNPVALDNSVVATNAAIGWSKISKTGAVASDIGAAATSHYHDASAINGGVFDVARIPVLPSQIQILSSGAIADLTSDQQALIGQGTIVTTVTGTTAGYRWVYSGTGSKVLETSYLILSDVTPEWTAVANKPLGNLTEATSAVLTISGGTGAVIGSGLSIQVKSASGSQAGYLSAADWTTFNGKQAGSATLTSLAALSTSTTGLVKLTNGVASLDSSAYLTGNQSISLTGDVTGSGTTAITTSISAATVTGKVLTGYAIGANTALAATDTILGAFGKVQGQFGALSSAYLGIGATAAAATKLATARSIAATGDASWSVSFDGSAGASAALTVSGIQSKALPTLATGYLYYNGTSWAYQTPSSGLANPLTTVGDLFVGGTSGAPSRLAVGTSSQILIGGTTPAWTSISTAITPASIGAAPAFTSTSGNQFFCTPNGTSGVPSLRVIVAADIPVLNYLPIRTASTTSVANFGANGTSALGYPAAKGILVEDTRGLSWRGGLVSTDAYWGFSQDASLVTSFKPFIIGDGRTSSTWVVIDPLATDVVTVNGGFVSTGRTTLASSLSGFVKATSGVLSASALVAGDIPALSYLPLAGGTLTGALTAAAGVNASGGSFKINGTDAITSARAGNLTALTVGSTTGFVRSTAGTYAASALVAADIPALNYLASGGTASNSSALGGVGSDYFVQGNGGTAAGHRTTTLAASGLPFQNALNSGFYDSTNPGELNGAFTYLINSAYSSNSSAALFQFQIAASFSNSVDSRFGAENYWMRTCSSLGIGTWRTLWHDGNLPASLVSGGPYLPLAGGTLTGALSGTSATFSGAVTATIIRFSNNSTNTFVGNAIGGAITYGTDNTLIGIGAGASITSGQNNTIMGSGAGASIADHHYSTFIGCGAGRYQNASKLIIIDSYGDRLTSALELVNAPIIATISRYASDQIITLNGNTSLNGKTTLIAGGSGYAQLHFNSGIAPSNPDNGDVWFDGTFLNMRIGGVTKTFTLT